MGSGILVWSRQRITKAVRRTANRNYTRRVTPQVTLLSRSACVNLPNITRGPWPACWITGLLRRREKASSALKPELRKAVVLLSSLPDAQAADLLSRLDPPQLAAIEAALALDEPCTPEEESAVLREFAASRTKPPGRFADQPSSVRLQSPTNAPLRSTRPFAFLQGVDRQALLGLLAEERTQTLAVVATHLPSADGAALVANLAAESQLAVIRAISTLEPVDSAVLSEVAEAIAGRITPAGPGISQTRG
jgi:hypothetical protein